MRNPVFDIMKGIGIIAVILGHCGTHWTITSFIYAWHMPLFFLVSGYFFRQKPISVTLKGSFRSLVVPYLVTAAVMFLLSIGLCLIGWDVNLLDRFLAIFVGAGLGSLPIFGRYFVGAIWFLLAIFWCKVLYNIAITCLSNKYVIGGGILSLFLLTVWINKRLFLPTDLLQGINAMLFFHIGHIARQREWLQKPCKWQLVILAIALLGLSMGLFKTDPILMVSCVYKCWPFNVLTAVGCCYVIYHISVWIDRHHVLNRFLAYFGSISILVLCVHIVDLNYGGLGIHLLNGHLFHFEGGQFHLYTVIWHIVVALFGAWCLASLKPVRKLFKINC